MDIGIAHVVLRECSPYLCTMLGMVFDDENTRDDRKSVPPVAVFLRKAINIQELQNYADHQDEKKQLRVIKTIVLSPAMYDIFRENLLFDWEFVRENTDLTYDGQVWDCALIRTTDRKEAI